MKAKRLVCDTFNRFQVPTHSSSLLEMSLHHLESTLFQKAYFVCFGFCVWLNLGADVILLLVLFFYQNIYESSWKESYLPCPTEIDDMSFRRFFKTIQAVAMSRIRSAQRYEKAALVFPNNGVARWNLYVHSRRYVCNEYTDSALVKCAIVHP